MTDHLPDAHRRIIALLRSLYDFLPEPETWTGKLQRRQLVERGVVAQAKEPCPSCSGRGRHGARVCDRCKGAGRLSVDPMTYFDPKTGKPKPSEAVGSEEQGPLRTMTQAELDRALRRFEESPPSDPTEYVIDRLDLRDRVGSYRELERALADLHGWRVYVYRLVIEFYVKPGIIGVGPPAPNGDSTEARALAEGMLYLEQRMIRLCRGPVRVPPWLLEDEAAAKKKALQYGHSPFAEAGRRERARRIFALRDEGMKPEAIGREVGLSRSAVYEILAAGDAGAAARRASGPAA